MGRPLRVLLVEDSESDAELIVRELRRAGFDCRPWRVEDLAELSQALNEQGWDVVLADHVLPGFGSTEVLALAARLAPAVPVVLVSGKIGEEAAVEAMRLGAVDYVPKDNLVRLGPIVGRAIDDAEVRRERDDALERLQRSEARYRQIVNAAREGIWLYDAAARTTFVNPPMARMLGRPVADVIGRPIYEFMDDGARTIAEAQVARLLQGTGGQYELALRHADGRQVWVLVEANPLTDDRGDVIGAVELVADITARRHHEERLAELATHDALTGLLNRRAFDDALDRQLARCARHGESAVLMLVDVDGLKTANDTFGHAVGDELLIHVARTLRRRLRATDAVARIGGDEFGALVAEAGAADARVLADSFIAAVPNPWARPPIRDATCSVGVAVLEPRRRPGGRAGLLVDADRALYEAKAAGGARCVVFESAGRMAGTNSPSTEGDRASWQPS